MKILAYEVRPDEELALRQQAERLGIELRMTSEVPSPETVALAQGCDGISMLGQGRIDKPLLQAFAQCGVRFLSTRTLGYDHIDLAGAASLGMRVCNSQYDPNGVADFAVMLMLLCLRKYKQSFLRGQMYDFSLAGLQGREMKDLTVGIIGTGRIGGQVVRNLSGFGCRILAYDPVEDPALSGMATYVDQNTLLEKADVISLHMPLLETNYHMVNRETIARMKPGVILINASRGELVDTDAMIEALEQGKIGALGLDTCEGEGGAIHADHRMEVLSNRTWLYLRQFPNVVLTPHMAFYTDAAVESMVRCGIQGIWEMACGEPCATEITHVAQNRLRWD